MLGSGNAVVSVLGKAVERSMLSLPVSQDQCTRSGLVQLTHTHDMVMHMVLHTHMQTHTGTHSHTLSLSLCLTLTHILTYTHAHTCTHTQTRTQKHTHTRIVPESCIHARTHTNILHAQSHIEIHYTDTNAHVCSHARTNTHTIVESLKF